MSRMAMGNGGIEKSRDFHIYGAGDYEIDVSKYKTMEIMAFGGAGGNGADTSGDGTNRGQTGGYGARWWGLIDISDRQSLSLSVGAGGIGAVSTSTHGQDGEPTVIDDYLTCNGGTGGLSGAYTNYMQPTVQPGSVVMGSIAPSLADNIAVDWIESNTWTGGALEKYPVDLVTDCDQPEGEDNSLYGSYSSNVTTGESFPATLCTDYKYGWQYGTYYCEGWSYGLDGTDGAVLIKFGV
ncbi:hypothetical protein [Pseudodesulfovibrio sp.]|uniref:glycine-rich domain-containing protein n=1 Tax=unclassified Pseudodesulfovibrio TaxID=2661612 RepID=UPI003B00A955